MARSGPDTSGGTAPGPGAPVVIDCDDCAARGSGCRDCVVSVLIGVPESLSHDERAALEVLADVGLPLGCAWCRSAASADPVSRKVVACRCPWSPIAEVRSSTAKW